MSEPININAASVMMRKGPDALEECTNELLYGEVVTPLNDNGQWGHVRAQSDGYEGFIPLNALKFHQEKTHKVLVPMTHIYDAPNFKTDPRHALYFMSRVHLTGEMQNGFAKLYNGGWVFDKHLMPVEAHFDSPVDLAMMYLNAPYIWGGRSIDGVDCSGLIQLVLTACGKACPRDSTQQFEAFKTPAGSPKRGDLVFFDGHVGMLYDEKNILSATARHMRTLIEPLAEVEAAYNGIKSIVRV